ncbi:glycosyltransferase family 2 protein [Methanobrevibacter sp.]
MSLGNPLVSIIIPVYNTEEYLRECLDCLINQTLIDIEVICIDDGSSDNSLQILNEYSQKDKRIYVLENRVNQGQSISRNKGLDIANGEYITFLDSDDYVEYDAYEKLYTFAKYHNHDLVAFDAIRFNNIGIEWKSILHSKAGYDNIYANTSVFEHKKLIYDTSITKFIKKDFIDKYNFRFIENVIYEDLLFSMEILCASKNLGIFPEVKYHWRVGDTSKRSVTQSVYNVKNLRDRLIITGQIFDLFNSTQRNKTLLDVFYDKLIEIDIMQFINKLDYGDDEYKRIMYEEVKPLILSFPNHVFNNLDNFDKYKYKLFLKDEWEDLYVVLKAERDLKESLKKQKILSNEFHHSNQYLLKKNQKLQKEIKEIKTTKGWFKYKIDNIYRRIFGKI